MNLRAAVCPQLLLRGPSKKKWRAFLHTVTKNKDDDVMMFASHDMRTLSVLTSAPRHKDGWRSGGIVPHTVNLGITWSRAQLHAPPAISALLIVQEAGRAVQPLGTIHRKGEILPKPDVVLSFLYCPTRNLFTLQTETCDISILDYLVLEGRIRYVVPKYR